MGRNSGGYTIIEVMIVLAISGLLFVSAVLVFQGEQGRSSFSQAMQDLNSKIQSYASEISAGSSISNSGYYCTVNGSGQPQLNSGSGDSTDCVFLGRVIHINRGTGDLQAFAVVGSRDVWSGGDTGQLATDITDANPVVAATAGPNPQLEEDYTLIGGATFVWSQVTPTSGGTPYDLLGLYNNLQGSGGSSSTLGNSLLMEHYQCNGGGSNPCGTGNGTAKINKLDNCLDTSGGGCNAVDSTQQWFVCVKGGNGQEALLEVDNTSSGLRTKLNFATCS